MAKFEPMVPVALVDDEVVTVTVPQDGVVRFILPSLKLKGVTEKHRACRTIKFMSEDHYNAINITGWSEGEYAAGYPLTNQVGVEVRIIMTPAFVPNEIV